MSHDIEVSDPLSWAIGEFREELLLWIDTELVRLRGRAQAEDLVMEGEPAAVSGSPFSDPSGRLGASRGSPYSRPEMAREAPRTRERLADRDSVRETTRPPVALPALQTDAEPRTPLANPRQRLDALARLLDHRLKQAHGGAETGGGAGKGPNTGGEDDTP